MSELNDPRVLFAAERTSLAWNRTSLALMAFGFVIERFEDPQPKAYSLQPNSLQPNAFCGLTSDRLRLYLRILSKRVGLPLAEEPINR